MNIFRKNRFYVFGKKYIKNSFENYHSFACGGIIIVADKKYKLLDAPGFAEFHDSTRDYLLRNDYLDYDLQASLIIVVYSAVDPDSYEYVKKSWNLSIIKQRNPNTPVFLVVCNADQRKEIEKSTEPEQTISEKKGVQLAQKIKAAKFLECSGYDVSDLKKINQNQVRVSARNRMRPIHAVVLGTEASGKTKMIQCFVQSDCLNVLDECLNWEQFHRINCFETVFSSFVEIDGEEHDLLILDAAPTDNDELRILKPSYYRDFF